MTFGEKDRDLIVDRILDGKCVLLVGPEIAVSETGNDRYTALKEHLDREGFGDIFNYSEDEMLSCKPQDFAKESLALNEIKNFYDDLKPPAIFEKIAEIPFQLMLVLSPDELLRKVFQTKGLAEPTFGHYRKKKQMGGAEIPYPSQERPVIYNLLGKVSDEESLVFTYDALFDYFDSMFGKKDLFPTNLRLRLQEEKYFLFLGFKFDRWYLRLLFRILELHGARKVSYSNDAQVEKQDEKKMSLIQSFFSEHFRITFLNGTSPEEIIEALHKKCADYKGKNFLRQPQSITFDKKELEKWFIENRWEDLFSVLKKGLPVGEAKNFCLTLESNYNHIEREKNAQRISAEHYNETMGKIKAGILGLSQKL